MVLPNRRASLPKHSATLEGELTELDGRGGYPRRPSLGNQCSLETVHSNDHEIHSVARRWEWPEVLIACLCRATATLRNLSLRQAIRVEFFMAWVATKQGEQWIWLRSLQSGAARALPGTEGARGPFWSSRGRSITFFSRGRLMAIELATGAVTTIGETPGGTSTDGGTWSAEDVILFSGRFRILRTTSGGAPPIEVARLDPGLQENSLRHPVFPA